jgi:hypothetical protein
MAPDRRNDTAVRCADRPHGPRRTRRISVTYTEAEFTAVAAAASMSGLTVSGYAAEAALGAARGVSAPSLFPARAALLEVMAARTQVRRFGVNVNQAVRALNSTGQVPDWLMNATSVTVRVIEHLDLRAEELAASVREVRNPRSLLPRQQ